MARLLLTDDEWESIAHLFPEPAPTGRPPRDRRTVFNGILWILRTGSPWRDLPEEFGPWQTVWRLFDQWNDDGTLATAQAHLQASLADAGEISDELWCVDGTVVRAARCAAGGGKKGSGGTSRSCVRPLSRGIFLHNSSAVRLARTSVAPLAKHTSRPPWSPC